MKDCCCTKGRWWICDDGRYSVCCGAECIYRPRVSVLTPPCRTHYWMEEKKIQEENMVFFSRGDDNNLNDAEAFVDKNTDYTYFWKILRLKLY